MNQKDKNMTTISIGNTVKHYFENYNFEVKVLEMFLVSEKLIQLFQVYSKSIKNTRIPFSNDVENIGCFCHVFVTHSLSLSC